MSKEDKDVVEVVEDVKTETPTKPKSTKAKATAKPASAPLSDDLGDEEEKEEKAVTQPPTDVKITGDGTVITGKASEGSEGVLTAYAYVDSKAVGKGDVDESLSFSMVLIKPLTNGETIEVKLTTEDGVVSPSVTITAPIVKPEPPKAPTSVKISADGSTITGKGVKDLIVAVKVDSVEVGNGRVDSSGAFTVKLETPLVNGETVEVVLEDSEGQHSPSVTITAPIVKPEPPKAPTDVKISEDGVVITGSGDVGLDVSCRVDNVEVGNGDIGSNGKFVVTLETPLVKGETIKVSLFDTDGLESPSVTITAPIIDEGETPEPKPPVDNSLMYIREMPWRNSAFLVVRFGALYEINKIQEENGEDWTSVEVDESKYKFAKEIKTIAHMIKTYENVEVQESRNGYILNKEQLKKGNFYK